MNDFFKFKQFTIFQENCAMKVGTDGVLLGAWCNIDKALSILDVGTGTGLIAIMLAQRSQAKIDAIEIEKNSFNQAVINVNLCPWKDRISTHHTAFQDYAQNTNKKFDHIISNPPYFVNSLNAESDYRNIARHSDTLPHSDLLDGVSKLLTDNGRFSVILPFAEGCIMVAEAIKYNLFCSRKTSVLTGLNQPIKRLLLEFTNTPQPCTEEELSIHTTKHNTYSDKYIQLTRDFYLKM